MTTIRTSSPPTHATALAAPHMHGIGTYAPRRIRFLGLFRHRETTLKAYSISVDQHDVPDDVVQAATHTVALYLEAPRPPVTAGGVDWGRMPRHGLGSLIVHRGRDAIFVLVDVWVGECMLQHHVWVSALNGPPQFESLAATDVALCVWELEVVQHERAAWLRHVLRPDGRPDRDGYLRDVLTVEPAHPVP